MVLVVSLPQQIAYVYRNGVLIGATTVSTGKKGKETPTGVFTILQKNVDHYSNIYNSAPMPYMQRLTWSGIALHAGKLPGYPASMGCVRMPYDFAKLLYAESSTGITVVVSDAKSFPTTVANPGLFAPIGTKGELATVPARNGKYFAWQPELATEGPISILVTGADRSIRVFRNGEQIGWSVFTLDDPKRVLTFQTYMALEEAACHRRRKALAGGRARRPGDGDLGQRVAAGRARATGIPESTLQGDYAWHIAGGDAAGGFRRDHRPGLHRDHGRRAAGGKDRRIENTRGSRACGH